MVAYGTNLDGSLPFHYQFTHSDGRMGGGNHLFERVCWIQEFQLPIAIRPIFLTVTMEKPSEAGLLVSHCFRMIKKNIGQFLQSTTRVLMY